MSELWTRDGLKRLVADVVDEPVADDDVDWEKLEADALFLGGRHESVVALRLRYNEQWTYSRIGEVFSKGREAARTWVSRGVRVLRHPASRGTWDLRPESQYWRDHKDRPPGRHEVTHTGQEVMEGWKDWGMGPSFYGIQAYQALRADDVQVNELVARWKADLGWVATSEVNPDA